MNTLCCMSLTLAARIIAKLGLSLSILIINIVMSEFFGRPRDGFFDTIEPWTLLGLNWTRFIPNSNISKHALIIFTCFFGYLILYLLTSSLLAIGTVVRRPLFSIPWLYFQITSIADQLIALIIRLTSTPDPETAVRSHWYIPLCSLYLMCTVYFWMVVFAASEEWSLYPNRSCNHVDIFNEITNEPIQIIQESRTEKSPSFLAQNKIHFDILTPPSTPLPPPSPLTPDKYDIV